LKPCHDFTASASAGGSMGCRTASRTAWAWQASLSSEAALVASRRSCSRGSVGLRALPPESTRTRHVTHRARPPQSWRMGRSAFRMAERRDSAGLAVIVVSSGEPLCRTRITAMTAQTERLTRLRPSCFDWYIALSALSTKAFAEISKTGLYCAAPKETMTLKYLPS